MIYTGIFSLTCYVVLIATLPSSQAQFGGSDPSLAGPYFVKSNDGRTCIYYRIRNFAIRGYNTQSLSNLRSPTDCARLCNDQSWCNSFEYATDGRCNVNANDIYVPETITAWNTAFDWDYWQLRDCLPAGSLPGSSFSATTGQAAPPADSGSSPANPAMFNDPILPAPTAPGPGDVKNNNNNNGAAGAKLDVSNGQNRGAQRIKMPVRDVPGFPSVSATAPPAADSNGARIQNQ